MGGEPKHHEERRSGILFVRDFRRLLATHLRRRPQSFQSIRRLDQQVFRRRSVASSSSPNLKHLRSHSMDLFFASNTNDLDNLRNVHKETPTTASLQYNMAKLPAAPSGSSSRREEKCRVVRPVVGTGCTTRTTILQ